MHRLLLFVPCEKVILSQGDNAATLINLMQGLAVPSNLPIDAALPITWFAYAQWERGETDIETRIDLVAPNATVMSSTLGEIVFESDKRFHRMLVRNHGFRFLGGGDYWLRLYRRPRASQEAFIEIAAYPIPMALGPEMPIVGQPSPSSSTA